MTTMARREVLGKYYRLVEHLLVHRQEFLMGWTLTNRIVVFDSAGVPWYDQGAPPPGHEHWPHTYAWTNEADPSMGLMERCPCGAWAYEGGEWQESP